MSGLLPLELLTDPAAEETVLASIASAGRTSIKAAFVFLFQVYGKTTLLNIKSQGCCNTD